MHTKRNLQYISPGQCTEMLWSPAEWWAIISVIFESHLHFQMLSINRIEFKWKSSTLSFNYLQHIWVYKKCSCNVCSMCTHCWHCSTCIKLNRRTAFEKNCKDFNSICTEVLLTRSLVYCPCSITVYWEWISCAMEEERMKSIISLLWRLRSTNAFCHFALNWLFIFSASLFVISSLINFTIWGESVCVCF